MQKAPQPACNPTQTQTIKSNHPHNPLVVVEIREVYSNNQYKKTKHSTKFDLLFKHFSNKLVLAALAVIITVFVLFIALPILSVFLRLDLSQALAQLQSPEIVDAILLGVLTSVVATVISFVFAVPTAYVLATRQFRGKVVLDTLMDIPMVLPPAVAGVALLLAFAPKGLIGPVFNGFGLVFPGSTIAVILAQVFVASPLVLRSAKSAFENLNPDIVNSAKILSGSKLRVFLTVTLPLSSHQILMGVMMTWARSMGEFGATLMFAGNLPGITQTMPLAIYMLMAQDPYAAIVLSALMIAFSFSILIGVKLLDNKRYGVKHD